MPHIANYHYTEQRPPLFCNALKLTLYSRRSLRTIFKKVTLKAASLYSLGSAFHTASLLPHIFCRPTSPLHRRIPRLPFASPRRRKKDDAVHLVCSCTPIDRRHFSTRHSAFASVSCGATGLHVHAYRVASCTKLGRLERPHALPCYRACWYMEIVIYVAAITVRTIEMTLKLNCLKLFWNCFETVLFRFHFICADSF